MNRIYSILVVATFSFVQNSYAQNDTLILIPRVDERVELLSIVFRLAGNFEYSMSHLGKYTSDIDNFYRDFVNHPLITFAKHVAEEKQVGFDAVMKMAIHLSQPPDLNPIVKFSDTIPDQRWGMDNALRFVTLLQTFYKDANCAEFFKTHRDFYRAAEKRFQSVTQDIDLTWYTNFYGELPRWEFNLYIGMNNGGANYGPKVVFPGGKEDLYSIIGASKVDSEGMPFFDNSTISTIIHEFNHSFVNPMVDTYFDSIATSANGIFETVAPQMSRMAYGDSKTMLKESLVRAAVINYFRSHAKDNATLLRMIKREQTNGFVWMDELFSLFNTYEGRREQYSTFASFMPAIATYYVGLASHIEAKIRWFDSSCVHVTSIEPFDNKSEGVDPSITHIVIHVDKALDRGGGYSINIGSGGKEHYPVVGTPIFGNAGRTIELTVRLKPEWDYSFVLTGFAFESVDGYPLKDYTVEFKTNK